MPAGVADEGVPKESSRLAPAVQRQGHRGRENPGELFASTQCTCSYIYHHPMRVRRTSKQTCGVQVVRSPLAAHPIITQRTRYGRVARCAGLGVHLPKIPPQERPGQSASSVHKRGVSVKPGLRLVGAVKRDFFYQKLRDSVFCSGFSILRRISSLKKSQ